MNYDRTGNKHPMTVINTMLLATEIICLIKLYLIRITRGKRPMRGKRPFTPSVSQSYYLALMNTLKYGDLRDYKNWNKKHVYFVY